MQAEQAGQLPHNYIATADLSNTEKVRKLQNGVHAFNTLCHLILKSAFETPSLWHLSLKVAGKLVPYFTHVLG